MAQLHEVLSALVQGKSIQRSEWEPIIRMYVSSATLMCQCGDSKPWRHDLSWDDIEANDWRLFGAASVD